MFSSKEHGRDFFSLMKDNIEQTKYNIKARNSWLYTVGVCGIYFLAWSALPKLGKTLFNETDPLLPAPFNSWMALVLKMRRLGFGMRKKSQIGKWYPSKPIRGSEEQKQQHDMADYVLRMQQPTPGRPKYCLFETVLSGGTHIGIAWHPTLCQLIQLLL